MRFKKKFKAFAVCGIIILFLSPIYQARGEVDNKKEIIGKWDRYDPKHKGKETMEFFKDGTVSLFHESFGFPGTGDYKLIDNNHVKVNLGGLWSLVGPIVCKVSISANKLTLTFPDGDVAEYNRASSKIIRPSKETTGSIQKFEKQTEQQIAGYIAEFNNINTLLQGIGGAVLKCPKQSCNDYEEEAAKVLISHLVAKKSGKWVSGFIAWEVAKKLILSGLDELTQMVISPGIEVGVEKTKEIIEEIKQKFEKSRGADVKIVSLGWKNIGVLPIYLPYKSKDGRYGKVDGEALMVFYSPHSISIKEIKEQVKSGGGRLTLYVPPIGLDEKLRQLPDEGIVRPFKLIIRGTVYELGEVKTYESWGETIKGPQVTFLDDKESVSPKVQITSSLRILEPPPYKVGDDLTAAFLAKNTGPVLINLDVFTVGGRVNDICPNDKCPDFEWKRDITLKPNEVYNYKGRLKLETPGDYHFFATYKTKDGKWNTTIPTAPGVSSTKDILVGARQDIIGKYVGKIDKGQEISLELKSDGTAILNWIAAWEVIWYSKSNPPYSPSIHLHIYEKDGSSYQSFVAGNGKEAVKTLQGNHRVNFWHIFNDVLRRQEGAELIKLSKVRDPVEGIIYPGEVEVWSKYKGKALGEEIVIELKRTQNFTPSGWKRLIGSDGPCFFYSIAQWKLIDNNIKLWREGEEKVLELDIKGNSLVDKKGSITFLRQK